MLDLDGALEKSARRYRRWAAFLAQEVDFWNAGSAWHNKAHCARVLLLALLLGNLKNLPDTELDALAAAAVFHDARRLADGLDTGHGQRAAEHYRAYCKAAGLACDERVYSIIACHDREDALGLRLLQENFPQDPAAPLLYRIFKDADGLDRFRLGPGELDPRYLRTAEARELPDFAKRLLRDGPEKVLAGRGRG